MSEKKELNKEELEKVTGGGWFSKLWEKVKSSTKDSIHAPQTGDNAIYGSKEEDDTLKG